MIFELAYELLPYAAALYVVDSAVRVRGGETLLASSWGGRFRGAGPGWHLPGLLPTAEVFVVGSPTAGPTGAAVAAATPGGATPIGATPIGATPGRATPNRATPTEVVPRSSAPGLDVASALAAIRQVRDAQTAVARPLAALGAVLLAIVFGALPLIVYLRPRIPVPWRRP